MCVVTYFPNSRGFVFTSNRDENGLRKTLHPQLYRHQRHTLLYPKDLKKGGTWFALNKNQKKVACVLNATGQLPQKNKPISRGQIPLNYLTDDQNFLARNRLIKTAPFTLITIDFNNKIQIEEFHWNGKRLSEKKKDETKPQIWCSNTLYNEEKKQSLTKKFEQHLMEVDKWKNIFSFHRKIALPNNSPEYLIKNKNIQTVSIISLNLSHEKLKTHYSSLIEESVNELNFEST